MAGFVYAWGMQEQETPTTIPDLKQVVLRLAQPHERPRWDALMAKHHDLGFKQLAGRGLRYVAEYEGEWLALVGWQTGVFQCRPRARWLGWHKAVQFRRLHLIANHTRFSVLPEGAGGQHLASRVLGMHLRRLSRDWQQRWGPPIELAETFVDPQLYRGTVYVAAHWIQLGLRKGSARSNGQSTDKHGQRKQMLVDPLRARARARLADPQERPEWACGAVDVRYPAAELRSLRAQAVEDSRAPRETASVGRGSCWRGRAGRRAGQKRMRRRQRILGFAGTRPRGVRDTLGDDLPAGHGADRPGLAGTGARALDATARGGVGAGGGWQAHSRGQPAVGDGAARGDGHAGGPAHGRGGEPQLPRGGRRAGGLAGLVGRGGPARTDGDAGRGARWARTERDRGTARRAHHGADQRQLRADARDPERAELGAGRGAQLGGSWLEALAPERLREALEGPIRNCCRSRMRSRPTASRTSAVRGAGRGQALLQLGHFAAAGGCLGARVTGAERGHWRVESANHYRRDKVFGEAASRVRTATVRPTTRRNNLALALLLSQPQETVPEAQIYSAGNRAKALQLRSRNLAGLAPLDIATG